MKCPVKHWGEALFTSSVQKCTQELRMQHRCDAKSLHRPNPPRSDEVCGGLACDLRGQSFVPLRKETLPPISLSSSMRDQCVATENSFVCLAEQLSLGTR